MILATSCNVIDASRCLTDLAVNASRRVFNVYLSDDVRILLIYGLHDDYMTGGFGWFHEVIK